MEKVKISVLIPAYNHEKYIKKCIDSVVNQTFKDIEIIIGDDCSNDNTKKIVNSYHDKRIKKVFFEKHVGGAANLNRIIDLAHGKYIAVLNSDDYWEEDKLQKQYEFMEKNQEYAACFTWARLVDEKGKEIYSETYDNIFLKKNRSREEWFYHFITNGNCLCHPSILIKREIYEELGKYRIFLRQLPDFDMWIRIIKKYPIYLMEDTLTNFRILSNELNTSAKTEENSSRLFQESYLILRNVFDDCALDFFHRAFKIEKAPRYECVTKYDQAQVLANSKAFEKSGRFVCYEMISNLIMDEETLKILEKERKFSIFDLYEISSCFKKVIKDEIEIKPSPILHSRGYQLFSRIYNSKLYKKIRKTEKK